MTIIRKKAVGLLAFTVIILTITKLLWWRLHSDSFEQKGVAARLGPRHEFKHVTATPPYTVVSSASTLNISPSFSVEIGSPSMMPSRIGTEQGYVGSNPRMAYCCNISTGIMLEDICETSTGGIKVKMIAMKASPQNCTCLDFFYCRLVAVTAFSSNHFSEAEDMIASVQRFLPATKLYVYDLGLTDSQRNQLLTYCNVELRRFDFKKFPPHLKRLSECAWKPVMVKELAQEHEVIFYGDASVRLMLPLAENILPLLSGFPVVVGHAYHQLPIIQVTHDGMASYLNFTLTRKEMRHFGHIQAGAWVMWLNSTFRKQLLEPWADCALHESCISPPGAALAPCDFKNGKYGRWDYIGCHRYDQSAFSLILVREFGLDVYNSVISKICYSVFTIQRGVTHHYVVEKCH